MGLAPETAGWFLIVEDQPLVQNVYRRMTDVRPHRVATSAHEAVTVLGSAEGCIGVVVDQKLGPDSALGHTVIETMRARGIGIPAMLVTGFELDELLVIGERLGTLVLRKPIEAAAVRPFLCSALAYERGVGARAMRMVESAAGRYGLSPVQIDMLMAETFEEPRKQYLNRVQMKLSTYREQDLRIRERTLNAGAAVPERFGVVALARSVRAQLLRD